MCVHFSFILLFFFRWSSWSLSFTIINYTELSSHRIPWKLLSDQKHWINHCENKRKDELKPNISSSEYFSIFNFYSSILPPCAFTSKDGLGFGPAFHLMIYFEFCFWVNYFLALFKVLLGQNLFASCVFTSRDEKGFAPAFSPLLSEQTLPKVSPVSWQAPMICNLYKFCSEGEVKD